MYDSLPPPPHPFSLFPAHISLGAAPTIWMPGKGYSIYYSCLLNEHFSFIDINITLTRTMLLLSSDRWKYFYILQREGPSHIHLYTVYVGWGYTVVLEEKLRKYGLEFKEVKSTNRIGLPAIHVYATISIVLINSFQVNFYLPLKQWNQLWNVHCVRLVSAYL